MIRACSITYRICVSLAWMLILEKKTDFESFRAVCHMYTLLFCVSGCCFVTFFTRKAALRAQDALHNIKTLEGVSRNTLSCTLWVFIAFPFSYMLKEISQVFKKVQTSKVSNWNIWKLIFVAPVKIAFMMWLVFRFLCNSSCL